MLQNINIEIFDKFFRFFFFVSSALFPPYQRKSNQQQNLETKANGILNSFKITAKSLKKN